MRSLFLAALIFFLLPAQSALSDDSDSRAYASRLVAMIKAGGLDPGEEQLKTLVEARKAFMEFADEYPSSDFADDSIFVYSLIEFMGALLVPPRDLNAAKQMIAVMEGMAEKFPYGSLEPLTYSVLGREMGQGAVSGAFYIPYRFMPEYMEALLAFHTRDFKNAASRFLRLKESLLPIRDEAVAAEIYAPLYMAYLSCSRSRDAQAVLDEVYEAYPDSNLASVIRSNDAGTGKKTKNNH